MLDKLFARLRSWRQDDMPGTRAAMPPPPPPSRSPVTGPAGPGGPGAASGTALPEGVKLLDAALTPPPLPADAWAESESGVVITDSGIIILEPAPAPRRPATPALPPAPRRTPTPGELDWDDVLARARIRAETSTEPKVPPRRSSTRGKTK